MEIVIAIFFTIAIFGLIYMLLGESAKVVKLEDEVKKLKKDLAIAKRNDRRDPKTGRYVSKRI